ncbi:MAG: hypothetical protein IJN44_07320 [Clostridia bacterium]|nr:hypothetical protein [Clostridia bacterium]
MADMSVRRKYKKTLVIGLGGSGCAVAAAVKRMVGANDPSIHFIGFDTDTNHQEALGLKIVSTSRNAKVHEILRSQKNWKLWFPEDQMLMNRSMIKGAGQIRTLSRLAFADTIRRPSAMAALDEAINALTREDGNAEPEALKVMVISSFAGGTGSGMFMQLPLYLRKKYVIDQQRFSDLSIRGLFALPDVFLGSINVNGAQRESMYANAYAALKELGTINTICLSKDGDKVKYQLQIDDLFDSKKVMESSAPAAGRKPYDVIFFVDKQNRNRRELGRREEYFDLMARITYMQIYSPFEFKMDSNEDNMFMTQLQADGEAMYGSAGSARLEYPYEDIVQYCALRTTQDAISEKWTFFDKKFDVALQDAKELRRKESTVKLPARSEVYIREVNNLLDEKTAAFHFLREGTMQMTPSDENEGEMVEQARDIAFVEDVTKYIEKKLNEQSILKEEADSCQKKIEALKKRELDRRRIRAKISGIEKHIEDYQTLVEERTAAHYRLVADAIMPDRIDNYDRSDVKSYCILSLLEDAVDGERMAVHPLAARYLLYKVRDALADQKAAAEAELKGCVKKNKTYREKDYFHEGEEDTVKDSASSVVIDSKKSPFLSYLHTKTDFLDASEKQLSNLVKYKMVRWTVLVLTSVLEKLNHLIKYYERIFLSIDDITMEINGQVDAIQRRYSGENASITYLCASPYLLEKTYRTVAGADEEQPTSPVYNDLLEAAYAGAMQVMEYEKEKRMMGHDRKRDAAFEKQENERSAYLVSDIFRSKIIPYNAEKLAAENAQTLDLSVYKALEREVEAQLTAEMEAEKNFAKPSLSEMATRRKEILLTVSTKAAPYLVTVPFHEPNKENASDDGETVELDALFWGVNKDVKDEILRSTSLPTVGDYFGNEVPSEVCADKAYSRYAIDCYRSLYSVRLTEIPKFSEDEEDAGIFYKSYETRVNRMREGRYNTIDEACTPHLDKRWHSRQYLPMISRFKNDLDDTKAARAMWLSLLYDILFGETDPKTCKSNATLRFWVNRSMQLPGQAKYPDMQLLYNEKAIRPNQYYEIFKAFQQNELAAIRVLEVLEPFVVEDCTLTEENEAYQGKRANPLAKALICDKAGLESVETGDGETGMMGDVPARKRGALDIMNAVLRNHQAEKEEKNLIMAELWNIINQLTAQRNDVSKKKLCVLMLQSSVFANARNRTAEARQYILDPYFMEAMEAVDAEKAPRKKASKTTAE